MHKHSILPQSPILAITPPINAPIHRHRNRMISSRLYLPYLLQISHQLGTHHSLRVT